MNDTTTLAPVLAGYIAAELAGDRVSVEVTEILDHYGDTIDRHPHHHPQHPASY
jgi:hypothetical protein